MKIQFTRPARPWHWLKVNDSTGIPAIISAVAVSTKAEAIPGQPNRERHTLAAWALLTSNLHWKSNKTSMAVGSDPGAFWTALAQVKRKKTSHWLIGHHVGRELVWLRFFDELEAGRIQVHKRPADQGAAGDKPAWWRPGWAGALILDGRPTWVKCRWPAGVLNVVDVRNYVDEPLEDFAQAAGVQLPPDPEDVADLRDLADPLQAECAALLGWFTAQLKTWKESDCGQWRPTGSGLSWNAYRHRFLKPRQVLIHANQDALELERAAMVGGRCVVGFVGEVAKAREGVKAKVIGKTPFDAGRPRGPVTVWDINSLYPAVMGANDYPCRLACVRQGMSLEALAGQMLRFGAIAECRIKSAARAYPIRQHGQTVWRTGEFWTVLATPEIEQAMDSGWIVQVGRVALYHMADLFSAWAPWAYAKKAGPGIGRGSLAEAFGKILSVGLFGKWAQKSRGWHDLPAEAPPKLWGTFYRIVNGVSDPRVRRAIPGAVQQSQTEGETMDSFPAIAAHVTSYARVFMDRIMARLGPCDLLYHDTDSFHVLPAGDKIIRAIPGLLGDGLGELGLRTQAADAHYFGQKHYRLGDHFTLGSMTLARRMVAEDEFSYDVLEDVAGVLDENPNGAIILERRRSKVDAMPVGRAIGPTGWTSPIDFDRPCESTFQRQVEALPDSWIWQGQLQSRQRRAKRSSAS